MLTPFQHASDSSLDPAAISRFLESTSEHDQISELARLNWWEGNWQALSDLQRSEIQQHPARDRLALLAACGAFAQGQTVIGRQWVESAREWGCDKHLVMRLLVSATHNALGKAHAAADEDSEHAARQFGEAIASVISGPIASHVAEVRMAHQAPDLAAARRSQGLPLLPAAPPATLSRPRPSARARKRARAEYLNRNGELLYQQGLFKLAVEYFQRAIDIEPNDAWTWQNLAEAVCRLEVSKDEAWECEDLGRRIRDTGRWDVAVRAYRAALKISPEIVAAHQDAQTFAVEPPGKEHVPDPVFIVGCGHSGTSLMLAMLGEHPDLHPIPKESALFLTSDAKVQATFRDWEADCRKAGKRRWIEKTPPHIFQIHRFLAFRPDARFLLMLRDGRDVICSLRHRVGYEALPDRIDRWVYDNLAGRRFWAHPSVKVVRYEALVARPEATLRGICTFLGVDYADAMLDFHERQRLWYSDQIAKPAEIHSHEDHMATRNWQINQPIFDGRSRWQAQMPEAERVEVKASRAQRYLEEFAYVDGAKW
jgi:tetratricopeptide (TPR) repeat protein